MVSHRWKRETKLFRVETTMSGIPGWPCPERTALHEAKRRCHSPSAKAYRNYGGRGIRVCDEWRGPGGFELFYAHIGPRPSPAHSLDRIDNNGNYEPGNVRWATDDEQARNRRDNRLLSWMGRTMTHAEWARELGVSYKVLGWRIKQGWPMDRVMQPSTLRLPEAATPPTLGDIREWLDARRSPSQQTSAVPAQRQRGRGGC